MREEIVTPQDVDDLRGLDKLLRATSHLVHQFSINMTRDEAKAHFDARFLLHRAGNSILRIHGLEIQPGEVEAALAEHKRSVM